MAIFAIVLALLLLSFSVDNNIVKQIRKNLLLSPLRLGALSFVSGIALNLMGYKDTFWYDETYKFVALLIVASPIFLLMKHAYKKKHPTKQLEEIEVDTLPKSPEGRTRIVSKFNEKYNLNLTEPQIENIVNGSFQSETWANEILAMDKKYKTISEWYAADTGWLRAYLKIFNVQNVSTDFIFQKDICINNFNEVFSAIDIEHFGSIDECVAKCNQLFLTNFDEPSFMIAYRFLAENGHKYPLPKTNIIRNESYIDTMMKKYDSETVSDTNNLAASKIQQL